MSQRFFPGHSGPQPFGMPVHPSSYVENPSIAAGEAAQAAKNRAAQAAWTAAHPPAQSEPGFLSTSDEVDESDPTQVAAFRFPSSGNWSCDTRPWCIVQGWEEGPEVLSAPGTLGTFGGRPWVAASPVPGGHPRRYYIPEGHPLRARIP